MYSLHSGSREVERKGQFHPFSPHDQPHEKTLSNHLFTVTHTLTYVVNLLTTHWSNDLAGIPQLAVPPTATISSNLDQNDQKTDEMQSQLP